MNDSLPTCSVSPLGAGFLKPNPLRGAGFAEAIAALTPTIHRDTITTPLLETLAPAFRGSLGRYPWSIPADQVPFLQRCGIDTTGFGFKAHPHPVHKTIETHLLFDSWPHVATTPSSVMFMKPSKFHKLAKENPNFKELCNYRLTAKDTTRYPRSSSDLPSSETVFMHDALMYFAPDQIVDLFLSRPNIQKLYASLVVPPESDFTHLSLNPSLYRYRFEGSNLVYELESNAAHNYTQPTSAINWLKTTTIYGPGITLTVSRLDSWGPVHSLLIQRGRPPVHHDYDTLSFSAPDAICLPEPASLTQDLRHRLVPSKVYHELFVYVRAVRTLRVTDPAGFVRTQCSKPEYKWVTSAAWDNLAHFALQTAGVRSNSTHPIFRSLYAKLSHWVANHTFVLYAATVPMAAASIFSSLLSLGWLSNRHLDELTIAGTTLIGSRPLNFSIWREPTIWFRLRTHQCATGWTVFRGTILETKVLHKTCANLGRHRLLAQYLPQRPINSKWMWAAAALASIPAAALAVRWFLGPDSPQAMHDRYQSIFHPDPWELVLKRRPFYVNRGRFLDIHDVSSAPPTDPTPADVPAFTNTAPPSPPPPTPATPAHEPFVEQPKPTPPRQAEPKAAPAEEAAQNAQPTVEEGTGFVFNPTPAAPPSLDPERSALEQDPSAVGPTLPYDEIYPDSYVDDTAKFLSRTRNSAISSAPYPKGVDCLLVAVAQATGHPTEALWQTLCSQLPDSQLDNEDIRRGGLTTDHFTVLARNYRLQATFMTQSGPVVLGMADAKAKFQIKHTNGSPGHFELISEPSIEPSTLTPKINGGAKDLAAHILAFRAQDRSLLPILKVHTFHTDVKRAKNLISNMKNLFDGVLANVDPVHPSSARERIVSLDGVMDIATSRSVKLVHIAGFAGCGKSWPIASLLKTPAFHNYKVAVPTTELRQEWKDMLNSSPSDRWRVGTWESSLLKSARVLVIDEVYKMPRGYVDLALHADSNVEFLILLGDPLQGEYHSTHPSSSNHRLSSEIVRLRPYIDLYCGWTRRVPKRIANIFDIPTLNPEEGFVRCSQGFPDSQKILANSQSTSKTLQQCGYDSVTIASSQGSTYSRPATIHLDRNSRLLSHQHSLVAVTRSKVGIVFTGDLSILDGTSQANYIFSAVARRQIVDLRGVFGRQFPTCPVISAPITSRRLKFSGAAPIRPRDAPPMKPDYKDDVIFDLSAPFLGLGDSNMPQVSTHFLPETRRPLHFDIPSAKPESADRPAEPDHSDTAIEPIYPGECFENLAAHFMPAHDPETREIFFRGTLSSQFPHINKPYELAAQPSSLIAALHAPKNDPTLLPASIEKRLRFRESKRPYQITSRDELLGALLFQALSRAYRRDPEQTIPFNETLFIECIGLNEFAQLTSKTQAVIMANANRSDPDWRWTAVRIFAKAQHKVNEGSIFGPWKACQTLALMHDAVILLLGPVKKYQRIFDDSERPDHIYVHAGHTPFQMSKWCRKHLSNATHLANDYTAFDQSQHGEAVVLERKKMERVSIPKHLIDLHVYLKTNVETQFGPLTCMRLTGEPGTYDDNTDYNLAVIHLEYAVGDTPCMVSGDDSLLDREPPVRDEWSAIQQMLALRFKKERGKYATFCGYYVGSAGCARSPIALFAKLMIAVDDGSIKDKLVSYLTEFSVGHSLGDLMWTLLPVEAVKYQSACFDFFCRHAKPELKLCLKIGEVPEPILQKAFQHIKWASHAVYALLSVNHRRMILHSGRQSRSLPEDPEVSQLQGELLHAFRTSVQLPLRGALMNHNLLPLAGALTADPPLMTTDATKVGPAPDRDDRVDRQPSLPAPPLVLEAPPSDHVNVPFQWIVGQYAGDKSVVVTHTMAASSHIKGLTRLYRHARLVSCEIEFCPTFNAFSKPISIGVVWTVADITPETTKEQEFYGGRLLTLGGPVAMGSTTIIPCDLSRINPILKSAITYNDNPRVSFTAYACNGVANTILANAVVRGILRLSGPSGNLVVSD